MTTCSACEQLGQVPTPEHLASVAAFAEQAAAVVTVERLEREREIAALREQLATTASDGDQTLTMLLNAQNGALLAEVERLTEHVAALREALLPFVGAYSSGDWCAWCQRLAESCRADCAVRQARAALAAAGGEAKG